MFIARREGSSAARGQQRRAGRPGRVSRTERSTAALRGAAHEVPDRTRSASYPTPSPCSDAAAFRGSIFRGIVWLLTLQVAVGCGEATKNKPEIGQAAPSAANSDDGDPAATRTDRVEADDFCDPLCSRVKSCDEEFDRQTCLSSCVSGSGVISNLNPALLEGLYACSDAASCATIETQQFVADCLASAASEQEPSKAGKAMCRQMATASDECNFTDFEERACWQATLAFSEESLANAAECAGKRCELIVPCLDAALRLPSELDGTPIGFDEDGLSSGKTAGPASQFFLPDTAGSSPSGNAPTGTESDVTETTSDADSPSTAPPPETGKNVDSGANTSMAGPDTSEVNSTSSASAWSASPSDPMPETTDAPTSATSSPSSAGSLESTEATSSDAPPPPLTCSDCLTSTCEAETTECVSDDGCLYLLEQIVACDELYPEGGSNFDDCFEDAVDSVTSPESLYLFLAWLDCLDASGAACGCDAEPPDAG